ncbi:SCO family protein [Thermoactinomyces sp. AMNI-1]|uniref:SCO family protein n=2 Tax=Thermoactinomyces mirandus TaxID=2756294 RepID=A0A7W1XT17_9BACL|nr:SCO family protein [Thermoactinomyces mirandus]
MIWAVAGCASNADTTAERNSGQTAANNDVSALNWQVPFFTYTNQDGETFGFQDLKGKIWLTDFIFTRCPNICPPMTANMLKIQNALKQAGMEAEIVSFSVDPEYDQPEKLKEFAKNYGADLNSWHFVTGYSFEEIQKLVKDTFKGAVSRQEGPSPDVPVLVNHPSQFYLVDQNGKVVKFYDGLRPDAGQIVNDIKVLQEGK